MLQVRLWNDCYNNCTFCSLDKKKITNINDKKIRINKLLELEDNIIGIIGGEFFEGQLKGVENEWLNMVKNIKCKQLYITANLINTPYLLNETLNIREILICTSYDTTGRFKSNFNKNQWLNRVNKLQKVCCTIIPTQDIINDKFIDNIHCTLNLCEPHLGLKWFNNVNKQNYNSILNKENTIFNLPKRKDLLSWLIKRPKLINVLKTYKNNHFNDILTFNDNNDFIYESYNRFNDNNFMADCGHPYFSRCYADSDRCLICDLEVI